jgi:hypothetical protein
MPLLPLKPYILVMAGGKAIAAAFKKFQRQIMVPWLKAGLFSIKPYCPSVFSEAPTSRTSQVLWEEYGLLLTILTCIAVSPPLFLAASLKVVCFIGQDMDQFSYNFGRPRSLRHYTLSKLRWLPQLTPPIAVYHGCAGALIEYFFFFFIRNECHTSWDLIFVTQSEFLPPLRRLWGKPGSNPELLRCSLIHPVALAN